MRKSLALLTVVTFLFVVVVSSAPVSSVLEDEPIAIEDGGHMMSAPEDESLGDSPLTLVGESPEGGEPAAAASIGAGRSRLEGDVAVRNSGGLSPDGQTTVAAPGTVEVTSSDNPFDRVVAPNPGLAGRGNDAGSTPAAASAAATSNAASGAASAASSSGTSSSPSTTTTGTTATGTGATPGAIVAPGATSSSAGAASGSSDATSTTGNAGSADIRGDDEFQCVICKAFVERFRSSSPAENLDCTTYQPNLRMAAACRDFWTTYSPIIKARPATATPFCVCANTGSCSAGPKTLQSCDAASAAATPTQATQPDAKATASSAAASAAASASASSSSSAAAGSGSK